MPESTQSADKVAQLLELLSDRRSLLIVMQDNPDPDSIAAAAALRRIANSRTDVPCSIAHGGVIGRGENRAMAGYLGLNFRAMNDIDLTRFDTVALVDTQPEAGNNSLPATRSPDIVLDHHPLRPETRNVPFNDVRRRYGAVSTILFEYLQALGLVPDTPLATALLYAIRTDTRDLGSEAAAADIAAAEALGPLANMRMLSTIQRGSVPSSYFVTLAAALDGARVYGEAIVSGLGDVDNPDMTGEAADLFLRHEGVTWVLCHGIHDGKLLLSLRTSQKELSAGDVMHALVKGIGTGGGHSTLAGGQLPLTPDTQATRAMLRRKVRHRFLKRVGATQGRGRKLVRQVKAGAARRGSA